MSVYLREHPGAPPPAVDTRRPGGRGVRSEVARSLKRHARHTLQPDRSASPPRTSWMVRRGRRVKSSTTRSSAGLLGVAILPQACNCLKKLQSARRQSRWCQCGRRWARRKGARPKTATHEAGGGTSAVVARRGSIKRRRGGNEGGARVGVLVRGPTSRELGGAGDAPRGGARPMRHRHPRPPFSGPPRALRAPRTPLAPWGLRLRPAACPGAGCCVAWHTRASRAPSARASRRTSAQGGSKHIHGPTCRGVRRGGAHGGAHRPTPRDGCLSRVFPLRVYLGGPWRRRGARAGAEARAVVEISLQAALRGGARARGGAWLGTRLPRRRSCFGGT